MSKYCPLCDAVTNCTDNCKSCMEEEMISTDIWYNPKATDEEIAECRGDYIGCEICCNVKRCFGMLSAKLEDAMKSIQNKEENNNE